MSETITVDLSGVNNKVDALGAAVEAMLKRLEAQPTTPAGGHVVSSEDGQTGTEVKSFGDFLLNIRRASQGNGVAAKRLHDVYSSGYDAIKDLSEGSNTGGGYTIPPDYRNELLQLIPDNTRIVRPRATVIPTKGTSITIPVLDQSTAPTGSLAALAGVVATWTAEAATKTQTEPAFKQQTIPVNKLAGYTVASDELLEDSGQAMEALLKKMFAGAIAYAEDEAFLNGSGSGKPLGIMHASATGTISVSRATGGNNFDLADALNMKKRLIVSDQRNVAWVMHPFMEQDLVNLALSGNTCVSYIPNMQDAIPLRLFGYPVILSELMADPGSAGDTLLGDFSGYVVADRKGLVVDMSIHAKFINDQTTWRFVERVGGKPWLDKPLPMARHGAGTGGSDSPYTRSYFVKLT